MKLFRPLFLFAVFASCAVLAAPPNGGKENHDGKKNDGKTAGAKQAGAAGEGLSRYGMAVYSDLCVSAGGGEFGGQRVTVQRFAEVDTVIYEYTAGGLSWPLVASDVNIDPRGTRFYFTVQPPDEQERTISGQIRDKGATMELDGAYCGEHARPMKLKKVTDFSRQAGVCKPCPAMKGAPLDDTPSVEPGVPQAPDYRDMPLMEVPPSQG